MPFAFYKQDGLFQTSEARAIHDLLAADPRPGWTLINEGAPGSHPSLPCHSHRCRTWAIYLTRIRSSDDSLSGTNWPARGSSSYCSAEILDDSGILRRELFLKDDERALTNYLHIFEVLLEEARTIGRDLADLVAILTAYIHELREPPGEEGNIQRLESDRAAVQIMTIHKSKGLEATVVFLYGGFSRFRSGVIHEYHEHGHRELYIGDNDDAKEKANEEAHSRGTTALLRCPDPGQGAALPAPGPR